MKFRDFRDKVKNLPYFRSNILAHLESKNKKLEVQLSHWVKKGYVIKLRQGLYTLSPSESQRESALLTIANNIYSPSYISLEYALQFYGFIPERVKLITSVTPNKTAKFDNELGCFSYRSIKQTAFCSFTQQEDKAGNKFLIATKEKALLDFLYFATKHIRLVNKDIFEDSFRLQNLETVSCDQLLILAESFKQKKLRESSQRLVEYIQEEWQND